MNLFIDTCSWFKLQALDQNKLFSIKTLYDVADVNITHDVLSELEYYDCTIWIRERSKIVPVKDKKVFDDASSLDFDAADASILSNGSKDANTLIISEDGPLLEYAQICNFSAIQLVDFFRILVEGKKQSKNDLYKMNRYFREQKNITRRKENEIKQWLAEYR
ncbi:MAG TPA: hypothetical protein VKM55_14835 [Candidatus Lokiarchaeia archaeon]|nr:hypothetical protein [Candidatus Lokiarchaeia archaeon]